MNRSDRIPPTTTPVSGPMQTVAGRWWPLAAMAIFSALVATAIVVWQRPSQIERVRAGLPAFPDLTGRPALLREALSRAQARAASPHDTIGGLVELGRLYHANGYRSEAEACWHLLCAEQPRQAQWWYYLSDLRRTASDYPGMATLLEQTVKLAPDCAPAWLRLADLEFKTGRLDAAERDYRQRLALLPGDPYAGVGLARVALQNGQTAEARRLIEQIVRDDPKFPPSCNLYAEMLAADGDTAGANRQRWLGREAGRFREADDPWIEALNAWCYDFDRLCVLATIEYQTERGDRGIARIERAIRLAPENSGGYEILGDLYLKLGEPAKARDTLERGIRMTKGAKPSPMCYVNLSHAYRMLEQPAEALRVAQQGLVETVDAFELHDALGVALGDLNRHEEAVAAFREALARNPNDSNTNFNLGLLLLALSRRDEAMAALKRSLVAQPTFSKTLLLLGQLELDAGRLESAAEYLRPLYDSHPEQVQVRQLMSVWRLRAGLTAEAKNDVAAAEQHYREGLVVTPNGAELNANLGVLCLVQGRFAEALAPLEAYHRLQPANPQSSLFLGQVYAALGRSDEARRILSEGEQIATRAGNATTAEHCREILQHL